MKRIVPLIAVAGALVGCAMPTSDSGPAPEINAAGAALTLEECAEQRDNCLSENPLFGLFTCSIQYTQCRTTAEDGLPAQVIAAVADARECRQEGSECRRDAESGGGLLACTAEQAECVATIVDVPLPAIVEGTAACVDSAVDCIVASESTGELRGCGETLADCAVEEAVSVLPEPVRETVEEVGRCRNVLASCTSEASTASGLAQCAVYNVRCVADGLGVTLPDPPVAEGLQCAEEATSCALDAASLSDLRECRNGLLECSADVVREELTCEQKWTACINETLNFFGCTRELATCTD